MKNCSNLFDNIGSGIWTNAEKYDKPNVKRHIWDRLKNVIEHNNLGVYHQIINLLGSHIEHNFRL